MPGVSISTAVRTGPVNAGAAPASTFFIVGETERGKDGAPVAVSSLTEYKTAFGGFEANKYTYQQIRTYFEEGGSRAYVARVVAADADKSSLALTTAPDSDPGITLTAVGAGVWGDSLYAEVANNSTEYDLNIYFGGTTVSDLIFSATALESLTAAIDAINNSTVLANYCTAALTPTAVATELLEDLAPTAFDNGADGTVAESDFLSALDMFTEELGSGAVAIPGLADGTSDDTIYDAIKDHCVANNRIGLLSFAADADSGDAEGVSLTYGSSDNSGHEHLAFYFPWVQIPSGTGVALTVPPEGYVAAQRSKAHNSVGSWQPFAGASSQAQFVTGVASSMSKTTAQDLDDARVNAIRVIAGSIRVYGARSHSTNLLQWRFINQRDTVNYIVDRCYMALEPLVFSTINGRKTIYSDISSAIKGVLEPIRIAGGLYEGIDNLGRRIDYGYTVKVDDGLNPPAQLEAGQINAEIGVRVSSIGDKIVVTLTKSNLTATLV